MKQRYGSTRLARTTCPALGQTEGLGGLMVTVPGAVAAVAAPATIALAGRWDRRWTLVALLDLLTLSNLIVAVAGSFELVLAGRVLMGVAVGGFWTIVVATGLLLGISMGLLALLCP